MKSVSELWDITQPKIFSTYNTPKMDKKGRENFEKAVNNVSSNLKWIVNSRSKKLTNPYHKYHKSIISQSSFTIQQTHQQSIRDSNSFTPLPRLDIFWVFTLAILGGMKCYLTVIFNCIGIITYDA